MTLYNPLDGAPPLDHQVRLKGVLNPGIACIVRGAGREWRWEEVPVPAGFGAPQIFKGRKNAEFTVTVQLTTAEHWRDWYRPGGWFYLTQQAAQNLKALQGVNANQKAAALPIEHPWLASLEITSAVVLGQGQPVDDGKGLWTIEIRFREFRPHRQIAQSKVEDKKAAPEQDPIKAANDARLEELQAEGARLEARNKQIWGG